MSKLKTIKAVAKRMRKTKTGKIITKKCGKDHFNARESGKVTRNKRRPKQLSKSNTKNIKSFAPYL